MRVIMTLFFVLFSVTTPASETASEAEQTLSYVDDLHWQQRIILIWPSTNAQEKQQLVDFKNELAERDVSWFVFGDHRVYSNYQGDIKPDFVVKTSKQYARYVPGVVLIGKDGGVKLTQKSLDLQAIFNEIDQMPMRQQEIKNKAFK